MTERVFHSDVDRQKEYAMDLPSTKQTPIYAKGIFPLRNHPYSRVPARLDDLTASAPTKSSIREAITPGTNQRGHWNPWIGELGAVILSIGSIVSAIATLRSYNDKPLSSWTFFLSLNTVVSILGVIARTTLAFAIGACIAQHKWNWFRGRRDTLIAFQKFDEASRGPWGSVQLLYWLKMRRVMHWAALGPFAVIIFLAFDPFIQATIGYHGRLSNVNPDSSHDNATLGRVERLSVGNIYTSFGNFWWIMDDGTRAPLFAYWGYPDFGIASATYNGFYNSSGAPLETVKYNCPSSNCTWPAFTTLAVCSSCNDVSSHITTRKGVAGLTIEEAGATTGNIWAEWNKATQKGTDVPLEHWTRIGPHNYTSYEVGYSHIKTFDGLRNTKIPMINMAANLTFRDGVRSLLTVNSTVRREETVTFQELETLLVAFLIFKAPPPFINNEKPWEESKPTATECALSLCVNAYNSRVKGARLEEETVETWTRKDPQSWLVLAHNNTAIHPGHKRCAEDVPDGNQTCASGVYIDDKGDLFGDLGAPKRTDLKLLAPAVPALNLTESQFSVSQVAIESTLQFMRTLTRTPDGIMVYPILSGSDDARGTPSIIFSLWAANNLTTTFANVAASITNHIRNVAAVQHQGIMQEWVTYIHVDWRFLSLPSIAMGVGCLYVMLTVARTAYLGLPAWKESSIRVMAHGIDQETRELIQSSGVSGGGSRAVRNVTVTLAGDGGGLNLKGTSR